MGPDKSRARASRHAGERRHAGATVDRDKAGFAHVPAEQRDPHQLALEDIDRVVQHGVERKGFPGRLMLAGNDARALRNFVRSPPSDAYAANDA